MNEIVINKRIKAALKKNGIRHDTYMQRITRYRWNAAAALTSKPRQVYKYTIQNKEDDTIAEMWSYPSVVMYLTDHGVKTSRGIIAGLFYRACGPTISLGQWTISRSKTKRK